MKTGYPKILKTGEKFCPKTSTRVVYDSNGAPISDYVERVNEQLDDLTKRRLCIFGDAISSNDYSGFVPNIEIDTFANRFGKHFGTYINNSTASTVIAKNAEYEQTYVSRISSLPEPTEIDVLMVVATSNDWADNIPIGNNDDTGITTYKGALKNLMTELLKKYYANDIIFVTPLPCYYGEDKLKNINGNTLYDYANAIKEIAAMYSIPTIDLFAISGFSVQVSEAYRANNAEGDNPNIADSYPNFPNNATCYKIYRRMLKAFISTI